jgi:hypothetical protein
MLRSRSFALLVAAVGLVVGLAAGPQVVSAQLAPDNVEAVVRCHENIESESRKFITIKLKALQQCVDSVVAVALRYEAGAINEAQAEAAAAAAERRCALQFAQIENASTVLINKIADACQAAEPLVVGYDDVLGFRSGGPFGAVFEGSTVTELAGFLCAVHEVFVDVTVLTNTPIVEELGYVFGTIPLDPRCVVPSPPDELR